MIKAIPTKKELKTLKRDIKSIKHRCGKIGINVIINRRIATICNQLDKLAGA